MQVETPRDARFSVQYCVAALMHMGGVRLAAFGPDALARADLRAFMPKVTVHEDQSITAAYPAKRQAGLTITLTSGDVITHFQPTRKGDPDDPLTDADLLEKYDELTAGVLTPTEAARLKHLIMQSDDLPGAVAFSAIARSGL
jgi:2-methylcitrate dehydratase PrpD